MTTEQEAERALAEAQEAVKAAAAAEKVAWKALHDARHEADATLPRVTVRSHGRYSGRVTDNPGMVIARRTAKTLWIRRPGERHEPAQYRLGGDRWRCADKHLDADVYVLDADVQAALAPVSP